jgi:hypothetical protein
MLPAWHTDAVPFSVCSTALIQVRKLYSAINARRLNGCRRKWPTLRYSRLSQLFPKETEENPSVTLFGLRQKNRTRVVLESKQYFVDRNLLLYLRFIRLQNLTILKQEEIITFLYVRIKDGTVMS